MANTPTGSNFYHIREALAVISHYEMKLNEKVHAGDWYDAATVAESLSIEYKNLNERLAILGDKLTPGAKSGTTHKA